MIEEERRRWTVRNVSESTIEMVREVAANSGMLFGELIDEAVAEWYDSLPEEVSD